MMNKKVYLLIIDAQNDFCSPKTDLINPGALYVDGAEDDMARLINLITNHGEMIARIGCSFDVHKHYHISFPSFWLSKNDLHPAPFISISHEDIKSGKFRPALEEHYDIAYRYLEEIDNSGRYKLTIWPPHCILGSMGAGIYPALHNTLRRYSACMPDCIDYFYKTANSFTEQYSILRHEACINEDDDIMVRIKDTMASCVNDYDCILIAGEALSHCVANSVLDIAHYVTNNDLSKFILLKDCSSCVKGFEKLGEEFVAKAEKMGMKSIEVNNVFRFVSSF